MVSFAPLAGVWGMAEFFAELKRRQMFRVAAAYAVVAWLLLQVVNNVAPVLDLPVWVARAFLLALVIGFPIALLFVWMRDLAPSDASAPRPATTKLDYVLAGGLILVIALLSYQQLALNGTTAVADKSGASDIAQTTAATGVSIAVLPFANLSGDDGQKFFSDGMTEEISSALAKLQGLTVLARSSSFAPEIQNLPAREKSRALNARYLIEGSVRQAGNRVRISAQLVGGADGIQIWSENYDRELTDIFAIQEDIARAIAGALRVPLGLAQGDTLVANRTTDVDSYQQYLRARALARARGFGPIIEAVSLLEQVVIRDPGYAPGWAWLAYAEWVRPDYVPLASRGSIEEQRRAELSAQERAEKAAREAIRLDPKQSVAYATLASIESINGRRASGEDLYRQALALDPDDPETLNGFGVNLFVAGRLNESLQLLERLRTLDVFVPVYNVNTARYKLYTGDTQAAIDILESAPLDEGGLLNGRAALAQVYAVLGRFDEAADTLLLANLSNSAVSRREVEEAARLLRSAPAIGAAPETLPVLGAQLNFVYAYVGARERMFDAAERFLQVSRFIPAGIWSSEFQPLRKTERFKAYIRNAGLIDYWRAKGWPDLCRPVGADDFECD
jgi:TolB-like protein